LFDSDPLLTLLFLQQDKHSDTNIKICDFGFAAREMEPNCLTTMCGSPNYVAPEIVAGVPYGKQVDMWSLGTITFLLLAGYAPFDDADLKTQYERIAEADYDFDEEYWGNISEEATNFVRELLVVDPNERMTAKSAKKHGWLKEKDKVLLENDLANSQKQLRKFNMKRKLKAAGNMVVATRRMTHLTESFADKDAMKEVAALAELAESDDDAPETKEEEKTEVKEEIVDQPKEKKTEKTEGEKETKSKKVSAIVIMTGKTFSKKLFADEYELRQKKVRFLLWNIVEDSGSSLVVRRKSNSTHVIPKAWRGRFCCRQIGLQQKKENGRLCNQDCPERRA
jgi:serine/threonine protein kinase